MSNDNLLPFSFPAVQRKKITAAFDGGRITSDGGVMLLAQAERHLGIADRLARVIPDRRDQDQVTHLLPDILRARIFAIACGYEDADDLDRLRCDPAFKLACGRLPDTGTDLCSQPTISRWENAPALRDLIRLMGVMVDLYCASYATPPAAVTLDIDDTVDVVHGHQQLSFFNAHYDERCFLPIHVYDTTMARPVAVLLRPGKTPSGKEVRGHLRRLVRRIRRHWPTTHITIRGDGHYGRPGPSGSNPLSSSGESRANLIARSAPELMPMASMSETDGLGQVGTWRTAFVPTRKSCPSPFSRLPVKQARAIAEETLNFGFPIARASDKWDVLVSRIRM